MVRLPLSIRFLFRGVSFVRAIGDSCCYGVVGTTGINSSTSSRIPEAVMLKVPLKNLTSSGMSLRVFKIRVRGGRFVGSRRLSIALRQPITACCCSVMFAHVIATSRMSLGGHKRLSARCGCVTNADWRARAACQVTTYLGLALADDALQIRNQAVGIAEAIPRSCNRLSSGF